MLQINNFYYQQWNQIRDKHINIILYYSIWYNQGSTRQIKILIYFMPCTCTIKIVQFFISFTIRFSGSVFLKVVNYIKSDLKLGYMCKCSMYLTQLIYLYDF